MLRGAKTEDLRIVVSWLASARDCELWAGRRVSFPVDLAALPARIDFTEQNAYTWVIGSQITAFGQLVPKSAGRLHLARVIVNPATRRWGHGEAFLRALLVQAAAACCSRVSLIVDEQNLPAISLYQRLGFLDASCPSDQPPPLRSRYMERA